VVVGNIGSEQRASYGAVGTPINAAYRIESFTVGGQILISPTTCDRVAADLKIQGTKEVKFKGLDEAVTLYDVAGIGDPYKVFLPEKETVRLVRLNSPLAIECYLLEGKTVSDTAIAGRITQLADNAAEVLLEQKLATYTNLRIVLAEPETQELSEWYAKVLPPVKPVDTVKDSHVQLQFTTMPEDTKAYLNKKLSDG
jgi:hypothetical protein